MFTQSRIVLASLTLAGFIAMVANGLAETRNTDEETPTKENTTIKSIMNGAHKAAPKGTGLLKKVAIGKATPDESKHLLALYKVMAELKPPAGEAESWKAKSGLLVEAVEAIIAGQEDGRQRLQKASHCKSCHDAHKS